MRSVPPRLALRATQLDHLFSMWSRRKLFASTLFLLRGEPFSSPCLFPESLPCSRSSGVCFRAFLLSGEPTVSPSRGDNLSDGHRLLGRFYRSVGPGGEGTLRCWNCGAAAASGPFLACPACRTVQPVDPSVDYFQIFGLERTYEIRDDNLEGKYKDWQKKLHPDLVHSKSEEEKSFAAEQSACVIDAYRTLSRPLPRALYLLQLEGVHVDEEKTLMDPELLAEMMEIREAIEEATDSQALNQIQSQIQTKLNDWSISFNEAFKKRDFDHAVTSVQRMRYYARAIEAIVKKL